MYDVFTLRKSSQFVTLKKDNAGPVGASCKINLSIHKIKKIFFFVRYGKPF